MNKDIKKILCVLALYALAGGIFYSFQELWLADNHMSVKTIGIVMSLCSLLSVSVIFLCSNIIKERHLKKFLQILILLKILILALLFILNNTGLNILIKFFTMVDYIVDVELYAVIYPLITIIEKNDKIYALRSILYDAGYYIGVLFTALMLGRLIGSIEITYNTYCIIAAFILIIAYIILVRIDIAKYPVKDNNNENIISDLNRRLKKDKISKVYLSYILMNQISYYSINGLVLTVLVSYLSFSAQAASNFNLILGLASVLVASIILAKLTFKNDYVNITIKLGGRLALYILACFFPLKWILLVTIIYVRLLSSAYQNVIDAPYVNRFDSQEQLAFYNIKEMVSYLGRSIGTGICGLALTIGLRYNFLAAAIFNLIALILSIYAVKLRRKV